MALLRHLSFLSTANFSTEHQLHSLSFLQSSHHRFNYSISNLSFCRPPSSFHFLRLSLAHTPNVRTKESAHFITKFASASQEQALDSSPSNVSDESRETEAQTEEFSKTRLLAQNVPWTCTPEDIRSLFERHGKVLDVEVCNLLFTLFLFSFWLGVLFSIRAFSFRFFI